MVHKNPNVNRIPDGPPNINDAPRPVKIGYRAVGGQRVDAAINLFRQILAGKSNVGDTKSAPNILCHWCVVVGDFYHQLQATEYLNWYDNNQLGKEDGWALFTIGETAFNNVAIKNAGKFALCLARTEISDQVGDFSIDLMREHYEIYNNNCQTFTVTLLDQYAVLVVSGLRQATLPTKPTICPAWKRTEKMGKLRLQYH